MVQESEMRARGSAFKVKVGLDRKKTSRSSGLRKTWSDVLLYADANMAYSVSIAIRTSGGWKSSAGFRGRAGAGMG
jgi:L-alanine-DL-glutamate epimerase-like enolase superfamily enzyme